MTKTASNADDEMAALEETILRLNRSLPSAQLSDAEKKQMLVRFKARLHREESAQKPSFWKRLFDLQANPQMGIVLAAVVVLIIAIVATPMLFPAGSSTAGTASGNSTTFIAVGLIGVLLVIYFISRRR